MLPWAAAFFVLVGLCVLIGMIVFQTPSGEAQAKLIGMPAQQNSASYERVDGPRLLEFPRDHGAHPSFQTEWWYYTGNLVADDGRRFGYQLTFFRRSLLPISEWQQRESDWGANQVYMAHFTLTDVSAEKFQAFERFERGTAGLAGALGEPTFRVWLDDWSAEQVGVDQYRIIAGQEDITLDLLLNDRKGPVLQGDRGYSRKGAQTGNASLYYSQTRLDSQGSLVYGGNTIQVRGESWMDREISTSALSKGQVGWDWFALQLDDGTELMVYLIREADGSAGDFSSGIQVLSDGKTRLLAKNDIQILPTGTWRSPHSGGTYPASWQVRVPSLNLDLKVQPQIADQELNVSFVYWEGSVRVEGTREGNPVKGYGYVELTGYAQSLEGGL